MRFLVRKREWVEIFVLIKFPVVATGAGLGPRLHQDIHAFAKPPTRKARIDWIDPIFHAGPERKRAFKPTARHDIEHRMSSPQPMRICEAYRGAEPAYFRALREHCKSACNH